MAQEEQCYRVQEARELISDPRYIIDDFIGSGAMACVYKAHERSTPNVYALKLLREKYRQRPQFLEIFQREAIHMRDLQYPNIVRFYKFVAEDNSAYILMDYVEGKPLTHYIQEARNGEGLMPLPKIVRIMAQIARAIAYLHAEGYIHRDIKPGNILLAGENESAFLTDLGIAGGFDIQDALGGAGTPSYMPYEQQTNGEVNLTADIYAFAVMLFELFTGRKPFIPDKGLSFQEARKEIIELHRKQEIPSLMDLRPELPEIIDEIFAQALAKNPADRYHNIMDFVEDIHEALLPLLPDDLKDFQSIKPQEILRSAAPEIIEVPATQPRIVLFVGIALLLIILALVFSGLWLNNSAANQTPSVSLENTAVDTESSIVALSAEPSQATTILASATVPNTESTPSFTDTPFMDGEQRFIFMQNIDAIGAGFGADLSSTLATILSENAPFVPLRMFGGLDSFYVEMTLPAESLNLYRSYGIAFRFNGASNYLLFRVDVANQLWLLENIENGAASILQQDALDTLPTRLLASAIHDRYRFEVDERIIPFINPQWSGSSASLYFELDNPSEAQLSSLSIGVMGDDARYVLEETPTYVPPLSPYTFLSQDLNLLYSTGDASAIVQCPLFVETYDSLARHNDNSLLAPYAQQAQSLSAFIYSRCLVADGEADFNNSYSDYLAWENGIRALIDAIGLLR